MKTTENGKQRHTKAMFSSFQKTGYTQHDYIQKFSSYNMTLSPKVYYQTPGKQ